MIFTKELIIMSSKNTLSEISLSFGEFRLLNYINKRSPIGLTEISKKFNKSNLIDQLDALHKEGLITDFLNESTVCTKDLRKRWLIYQRNKLVSFAITSLAALLTAVAGVILAA